MTNNRHGWTDEELRAWCHGEMYSPADSEIYARGAAFLKLLDAHDKARAELNRVNGRMMVLAGAIIPGVEPLAAVAALRKDRDDCAGERDEARVDSRRLRAEADGMNGLRIAAEHRAMTAERERDEFRARLAHAEADAEQAVCITIQERDEALGALRDARRALSVRPVPGKPGAWIVPDPAQPVCDRQGATGLAMTRTTQSEGQAMTRTTQSEATESGLYWFVGWQGDVDLFSTLVRAEKAAFNECLRVLDLHARDENDRVFGMEIVVFHGRDSVARISVGLHAREGLRRAWSPGCDGDMAVSPEEYAHLTQRRALSR